MRSFPFALNLMQIVGLAFGLFLLPLCSYSKQLPLIPYPQTLLLREGYYIFPSRIGLNADPSFRNETSLLKEYLKGICRMKEATYLFPDWQIKSDPELSARLGAEGYVLEITPSRVIIRSPSSNGVFYALQTIRQLLLSDSLNSTKKKLPCLYIEDKPRYSWRGSMLDIARRYFGPEYIRKHMERMALYKLNRLHLHLTDDQGWRIEIRSWPKLARYGGSSAVEEGSAGFLTQKQFKELQAYAKQHHIVIVPETDMPGHMYAALASYPEVLNCPGNTNLNTKVAKPPQLYTGTRVGWNRLCLTRKESYTFIADVLKELASITEGPWIHVGGDEIEDPLYTHFVSRADSTLRSYGKIPVGWEEIMKGKVDTSFISQMWLGKTPNSQGLKTIVSLCRHFYLDHANEPGQAETNNWCKETGVSLKDVYSYRPSREDNILGVEAPLWTELVASEEEADNRLWPRLTAVAEIGWSEENVRSYESFILRLAAHQAVFSYFKIRNYKIELSE